jgi:hypothetical protein
MSYLLEGFDNSLNEKIPEHALIIQQREIAAAAFVERVSKYQAQLRITTEAISLSDRRALHLKFDHYNLPVHFLTLWQFDAKQFLADSQTDPQIIKPDMAVAISGVKPCWLLSHIVISFFNKRDVYIFNKPADAF